MAGSLYPPDPEIELQFKRLTLGKMQVQAQGAIGAHTLHSLRVEQWADDMARRLTYRLTAEILAEKVLEQKYKGQWKEAVDVEVEADRVPSLPWYAAGIVLTFLAILLASAAAAVTAFVCAGLAVYFTAKPARKYTERKWVEGEVTVPMTYWRKFPRANVVYPEELGPYVEMAIWGNPSVRIGKVY